MAERSGWKGAVLVAIVVLQFAVPAVALLDTPPTRFGFQMYSAQGTVEVTAVGSDGREAVVDLESVVAGSLRGEFDWTGALPEAVCDSDPLLVEVTVSQPEHRRTVRCR